jgi:hypothetical protein
VSAFGWGFVQKAMFSSAECSGGVESIIAQKLLDRLVAREGIEDVTVPVGYRRQQIEHFCGNGGVANVRLPQSELLSRL